MKQTMGLELTVWAGTAEERFFSHVKLQEATKQDILDLLDRIKHDLEKYAV